MKCKVCGKEITGKAHQITMSKRVTSSSPTVMTHGSLKMRTYHICDDCEQNGMISIKQLFD